MKNPVKLKAGDDLRDVSAMLTGVHTLLLLVGSISLIATVQNVFFAKLLV